MVQVQQICYETSYYETSYKVVTEADEILISESCNLEATQLRKLNPLTLMKWNKMRTKDV